MNTPGYCALFSCQSIQIPTPHAKMRINGFEQSHFREGAGPKKRLFWKSLTRYGPRRGAAEKKIKRENNVHLRQLAKKSTYVPVVPSFFPLFF
jgi:hypothetical protein